jgi:protein-S-isoprenylcysteine O-methyltransferase Ste14
MSPYFSDHPVARLLFVCALGVWLAVELRQALAHRPEASSRDRGSLLILRLCLPAGAFLATLAAARVPGLAITGGSLVFGAGIALMCSGVALRIWSIRTLGRYFTFVVMTSTDQPVITSGPYRFVRHPGYLGVMLVLVGIGISYGNLLSLAALVLIPAVGFVYRIQVEEAALSATLGSAYTTYALRRKRLVPFLW